MTEQRRSRQGGAEFADGERVLASGVIIWREDETGRNALVAFRLADGTVSRAWVGHEDLQRAPIAETDTARRQEAERNGGR